MGPTGRQAHDADALEFQRVEQRGDVGRRVEQFASGPAGGEPEAGPVEADDPHARRGDRSRVRCETARPGRAVEQHDRRRGVVALLLVPQCATVG
jgi:hypothetical protein